MSTSTRGTGPIAGLRAMSSRARWLTAVAVVIAAVAGTWAVVASRDTARQTSDAPSGMAAMAGTDDMAGMHMSPGGSVALTATQAARFGVTFGSVEERTLAAETRTTGVVTFDETRIAKVAPKFGGYVERLLVDFTGQSVRTGQPLLEVYSPELVAAQEELLLARRLDQTVGESAVPGVPPSTTDLSGAAKRRLRLWDISEAQIEQILRSGRARRTLTIFSPASGVVVEKHVVRGQAFDAGTTLYTIAGLAEVWVDVELREADAVVRSGTGADIRVTGLPGRQFKGRVEYVYPTLDTVSRAVRARVAVTNSEGLLKPGMYATVLLRTPTRRALTVPAPAVVRTGERSLVFVDMGGGRLMPREVETGGTAGEFTEILSGVEPGQRVVTSAQYLLESESNLGDVMRGMMSQAGAGDASRMDMPGMRPGAATTPGAPPMQGMPGMDMKGADVKGMTPAPRATRPRR